MAPRSSPAHPSQSTSALALAPVPASTPAATAVRSGPLQPELAGDEQAFELGLRPDSFAALVGQQELMANLHVFMAAAKGRGDPLDHLLLCGPPGLGKTTIAYLLAKEMGTNLHATCAPSLEKKDLAGVLSQLQANDVLFIDEIHRLSPAIEELLYSSMEDFRFDLILGKGPYARTISMPLPKFTLVGATTRSGLLTGPLRDRFGFVGRMRYYTPPELAEVVRHSAHRLQLLLDPDAALILGQRARGTPRVANRLLCRIRDFAAVANQSQIDVAQVEFALARLGIDPYGLDELDRRLLHALTVTFQGGPTGMDTLAAAVGEETMTLETVVEPYLLQQGWLQRTPRGRLATPMAMDARHHFSLALQ